MEMFLAMCGANVDILSAIWGKLVGLRYKLLPLYRRREDDFRIDMPYCGEG